MNSIYTSGKMTMTTVWASTLPEVLAKTAGVVEEIAGVAYELDGSASFLTYEEVYVHAVESHREDAPCVRVGPDGYCYSISITHI